MPAFQPYWGKLAVRNDRGDRGNVGIIRSPVRASILPDHDDLGCHRLPSWDSPPDLSDIPNFTKSSGGINRLPWQAARSNGAEIGSPSGDSAQYALRAYGPTC